MPSPLSPIEPNKSTPQRSMTSMTSTLSPNSDSDDGCNNDNSSPFMSDASPPTAHSLPRARPISRIISGGELSPLKIVQQQQQTHNGDKQQPPPAATAASDDTPSPAKSMPPPPLPNSPRKMAGAPIKRFPIKVNSAPAATNGSATSPPASGNTANESPRRINLHDAIQENPGLKHAIEIFEDDESMLEIESSEHGKTGGNNANQTLQASMDAAALHQGQMDHDESRLAGDDEPSAADDTMISTFSNFSADMTMLARMRSNSPTKFSVLGGSTPRTGRPDTSHSRTTPGNGSDRSAAQYDSAGSNSTVNLLDFTEQLRFGAYSQQTPSRNRQLSPARTGQTVGATPQRSGISSLLDFDIPPMPTPRSIPTITPRELESLKSNFLSEISSLKASLSGKEAEVLSLKTAVSDAEKRVGECMEHLRDLRGTHDTIVNERDSWEKRGREMESVLRKVKEEIVLGQREREELEFKLQESEQRREAAEMMAQDAESKMAGMRAGKASAEAAADGGIKSPTGPGASNKEVEMAVERVARELHALYKSKHEVKVAALKKSYEGRWEKKVRELQNQVDELAKENEELRVSGRDSNLTKMDLARLTELEEERKREKAQDTTHIKELDAQIEELKAMLKTVQGDNAELRHLLERERVEKGELVQLAEEMMNMQQQQQQSFMVAEQQAQEQREQEDYERYQLQQQQQQQMQQQQQQQQAQRDEKRFSNSSGGADSMTTGISNFRSSISGAGRPSSLRAPGGGMSGLAKPESRIGRVGGPGAGAGHERNKSHGMMGLPRPGSGLGMSGSNSSGSSRGIMSSIEKMGSGGRGYGRE
ncbi:hypothetical protein QBC37DRAFT_304108 [Rhypophila decipiens]|uniref:Uncharacterized protein n=1 Tax=Rhypophila decipiens TaxID=261697 RepID=A0AAN6YI83_9PEZI|nr:hypothetical protein QBC37DRAFT_304108 [Rhypophila decipiens]